MATKPGLKQLPEIIGFVIFLHVPKNGQVLRMETCLGELSALSMVVPLALQREMIIGCILLNLHNSISVFHDFLMYFPKKSAVRHYPGGPTPYPPDPPPYQPRRGFSTTAATPSG